MIFTSLKSAIVLSPTVFNFIRRAPEKRYLVQRCITVIRGHSTSSKSVAISIPSVISYSLFYCNYVHIFYRFGDITIINKQIARKGVFISTQLNSTQRDVEVTFIATQLNSTRRRVELRRYRHFADAT